MTRPVRAMLVTGGLAALAWAAQAATIPIQLRVTVSPDKGQAAWSTPGVVFQKTGECVYSSTANLPATWPVTSGVVGTGKATAPLFNPGFPNPDGSYMPNTSDDGFNTIFLPLAGGDGAKSVVCRGTILANGKDVTAAAGRVVSRTVEAISLGGPPTVTLSLDAARLATVPTRGVPTRPKLPPAALATVTVLRSGSLQFSTVHNAADLESGQVVNITLPLPPGTGPTDIRATFGPAGEGSLRLYGDAQYASALGGSAKARGYAGCKNASYVKTSAALPLGQYLCIRTSEGHIAEISALLNKAGTPPYGVASYTVWN